MSKTVKRYLDVVKYLNTNDEWVGTQEISDHIGVTRRTAQRLCEFLVENDMVRKTAKGKTNLYRGYLGRR